MSSLLFSSAHVLSMEGVSGSLGLIKIVIVRKGKTATLGIGLEHETGDGTKLVQSGLNLLLSPRVGDVLQVHVAEGLRGSIVALRVLLERANKDRLGSQLHPIELLNGSLGTLLRLEVNKTETAALAFGVLGDLAGQDVAKQAEGVVESLVVNLLIQVLHIHVGRVRSANSRVTVRPHNAAGMSLDV